MKDSIHLILLLALLSSCMGKEKKTSAGNINASAPYLWADNAFPKTLKVSASFDGSESSQIGAMADAWKTALSNRVTFFAMGGSTPELTDTMNGLDSLRDDVMAVYKVTRWPASLDSGALAITQIFGIRQNIGDGDEYVNIIHADILVNYDDHEFHTADTGNGYDFRTVILHEMGHFIGLQHRSNDPDLTVMYRSIGRSTAKRAPKALDINDVASKYGISGVTGASARRAFEAPLPRDVGETVKILLELRADGECIHRENGRVIHRHSAYLH